MTMTMTMMVAMVMTMAMAMTMTTMINVYGLLDEEHSQAEDSSSSRFEMLASELRASTGPHVGYPNVPSEPPPFPLTGEN